MKQDRFDSIVKQMSSSMKMMLDYLKRYLDEGKASAFVGAGFSRNATMPETAEMKDWNMLGMEFYQRLYGRKPSSSDAMFLSPIHLASEVEASFGRNELDNLIIQSLPDDIIVPSKLHKNLLDLNWHDVFTTNYDTLLERAYLDTERPYTIVTNKETLLYSTSPRIVKLHGSFPNIRPFIITEEDYRIYPDRYPEFVNTVRQALVENLFCLIGFSGDDPNFKSWYGWLRDVMGQQIAPVYLITYNPDMHDAKKKLFAGQKIDVLNLADLPDIKGIQEGFEFLFQYLSQKEDSTLWSGHLKYSLYNVQSADDILNLTQEMAHVRRTYPGWFFLPKKHYRNFVDVTNDIVGFDKSKLDAIKLVDKILFLYELCWRQGISNTPIGVDWYVDMLTVIPLSSEEYVGETQQMVIELKLALLRHYRKHGRLEEFNTLVSGLESLLSLFKEPQIRLFYYERCLCAASYLDYGKLGTLINQWDVASTDYTGVLWKSCMLVEMDRINEAVNMLNTALRQLNISILANRGQTNYLKSCQSTLKYVLWLYSRGRIDRSSKNAQYDMYDIMQYYQKELHNVKKNNGKTRSHNFNVGETNTSWSFGGTGFIEEYLHSYRYFSFRESCGLPNGLLLMTLDKDVQAFFLTHLLPYNYQFAFAIIIRSCTKEFVKQCITRNALMGITRTEADAFFEKHIGVAQSLKTNMEDAIKERVLNILVPLLTRLSTKASVDNVVKLLEVQYVIYQDFVRYLNRDDVRTLYVNLAIKERRATQVTSLELPFILDGLHNYDFPQIDDYLDQLTVSEVMISRVVEGLANSEPAIQRNAFSRLSMISSSKMSDEDRAVLQNAFVLWQKQTKDDDLLHQSLLLPFGNKGNENLKRKLLKEDLERLSMLEVTNIKSSVTFNSFCNLLGRLYVFKDLMDPTMHQQIIEKFVYLVDNNEKTLSKDDSEEFFGGFHGEMTNLIRRMEGYLFRSDLSSVPVNVICRLTDSVAKLAEWNYRHLAVQILLYRYDRRLKESEIKNEIDEQIAIHENHMDAYQALIFLSKRNTNFQQIIQSIIRFCMYSTSLIVYDWMDALAYFVKENVLTKGTKVQLLKMLSFVYDNYKDNPTADADVANDIWYNAGRLAGVVAKQWGDTPETDKWKNLLLTDDNIFNEVRYAFSSKREL